MHFVDRKAKYPGRWTMKKSDGSSEIVTLIRNDEPEVEGTPMNAETLNTLSDVAGAEVARIEATKQAQSSAASAQAAAKSQTAAATSAQAAQTSAGAAGASAEKAAEEARKAENYVAADKTLSIPGAPADAKATGDALSGKADSVVPHDLSIPITGWQTDAEVAEYPHYIDITADVTSTTVVSVSIDPASADVAGKAMLVNPETRTGAIRIRAHNIPTAEISARWYSIKYGGQFYGDGSIYSNFLLAAHPVGSIYQTISPENPAVTFGGGTWEKIAQDRVLMGASDTHPAGTTVEAGLPSIFGQINDVLFGSGAQGDGMLKLTYNPVLLDEFPMGGDVRIYRSNIGWNNMGIYGASTTVQPPAYFTYTWLRTN